MQRITLSICLFFFFCSLFVYAEDFDAQSRITISFGKGAPQEGIVPAEKNTRTHERAAMSEDDISDRGMHDTEDEEIDTIGTERYDGDEENREKDVLHHGPFEGTQ